LSSQREQAQREEQQRREQAQREQQQRQEQQGQPEPQRPANRNGATLAVPAAMNLGSRYRTPSFDAVLGDPEDLEFGKFLNEGAAAKVYEGTYQFTPVAIKKLKKAADRANEEEGIALASEAKIMVQLRHANIVQFFALVELPDDGCLCFVMELMKGGSFRDLIDEPPPEFTVAAKARILLGSFKGLHYLHKRSPQVIHRDLKACNILLDSSWDAKLTDFGVSRFCKGATKALTSFAGTVAWMAPELLRAEDSYDYKVDVYAMGMVIFECLTHEFPFDGLHMGQLTIKVAIQGSRPQLWPTMSESEKMLQDLMVRCWSQEPDERPSCKECIGEVQKCLEVAISEGEGNGYPRDIRR
jgi:serine/threonine protein kinase